MISISKAAAEEALKSVIDFCEALASTTLSSRWITPSSRSPSFSSIRLVTSRLTATAIALVNDEIVPVLMIQRRAGQALLFYVRRGRHRGGIRQQRDKMQVRQPRQRL